MVAVGPYPQPGRGENRDGGTRTENHDRPCLPGNGPTIAAYEQPFRGTFPNTGPRGRLLIRTHLARPERAPSSVLADETKFVSVRVLHGELARAVRGVEERVDYFGTVAELLPPAFHVTDTEVVSACGWHRIHLRDRKLGRTVGKWAYVGTSGGQ
jgi:hypothetical protein